MRLESKEVKIRHRIGIIANHPVPQKNKIEKAIVDAASEGWVLIYRSEHHGVVGFAHTKLIFQRYAK